MHTLPTAITEIQNDLSSMKCRIVPTSFDPESPDLAGFPIPQAWHWDTCAQALSIFRPHGIMMRLPLFWQLEVTLWYASRSARAPIFLNDPENMPLAAAALRLGGIDTIVTERCDAEAFLDFLESEGQTDPYTWLIVHRANDAWDCPHRFDPMRIAQEVHLFPGLPIFSQCAELIGEHSHPARFHPLDEYRYDLDLMHIDLPARAHIPRFRLPFPPVVSAGICACGRPMFSKRV